ncbi:hypothetical protein A0H81_07667 [Grifola frondosa]|uniref:F-box domain-containing protein n=1 Tax=Grifola frondosa TaxID=5627 RepID=A0A1C7M6P3_GRIFR|nr:hypothetical protein A0H81_07667 [Grifola frondosa]
MDQDDEHKILSYDRALPPRIQLPLRLNEDLEAEVYRRAYDVNTFLTRDNPNAPPLIDPRDEASIYRVDRFLRSIVGFLKGDLDLSGRHPLRYSSLRASWIEFVEDMNLVRICGGESGYNIEPLLEFRRKWWIPDLYWSWAQLDRAVQDVQYFIARNPVPVIQQRTLLHLPTEMLDYIVKLADKNDALSLRQACRRFGDIVKRRTIERNFFICEVPDKEFEDGPEAEAFILNYVQTCVSRECWRALGMLDFALSDNNIGIVQTTKSFRIRDYTDDYTWRTAGLPKDSIGYHAFFRPITLGLARFLIRAQNITKLAICGFSLTGQMFFAISELRVLHTLEISDCSYVDTTKLTNIIPRRLSNIKNVIFGGIRYVDVHWVFEMLVLLSQVRSLSLLGSKDTLFLHGAQRLVNLLTNTHPFCVTERLVVRCFNQEVPLLNDWLSMVERLTNGTQWNLTHFKLEVMDVGDQGQRALERRALLKLVHVLRKARLQTLVLEGVAYVEKKLFKRIAKRCPRLQALTVMYRRDMWHRATTACQWPHPMWEYAQYLKKFRRLVHFGSNIAVDLEAPSLPGTDLLIWEGEVGPEEGRTQIAVDENEEDEEASLIFAVSRFLGWPTGFAGSHDGPWANGSISTSHEIRVFEKLTPRLNEFNPFDSPLSIDNHPWLVSVN